MEERSVVEKDEDKVGHTAVSETLKIHLPTQKMFQRRMLGFRRKYLNDDKIQITFVGFKNMRRYLPKDIAQGH